MQTYTIDIRPKRQTTLPRELLEALNLEVGDSLEAYAEEKKIILKPKKNDALDALTELQKIFTQSSISEEEFQKSARNERKKNS